MINGTIFDIKRFAIHDGPGIRTTIFMKGCTLRCIWCQNPEGIPFGKGIWIHKESCIKCGACVEACEDGALTLTDDGIVINHQKCTHCDECINVCPTKALRRIDRSVSVDELIEEVLKDELFFHVSNGGVTISGGEPLAQPLFVIELLKRLKLKGIHTCIETALMVPKAVVEQLPSLVDHFFIDCKLYDSAAHEQYVGEPNELILANIAYLAEHAKSVTVRVPLIPGITATEENLTAIARFIHGFNRSDIEIELLNYNYLCHSKYEGLGLTYFDETLRPFSEEEMRRFYSFIEKPRALQEGVGGTQSC